jgi:hypothetical protein
MTTKFETRKEREPRPSVSVDGPLAADFPRVVPLPDIPRTGSPVPWLTSIHGTPGRGNYGDAAYRGNCSGLLIRDLLMFYKPTRVADFMEGSGTCRDVCRELGVAYFGGDIRRGFDARDPKNFEGIGRFDFIWLHPPYWKMVVYNPAEPRCLSNATTLPEFRSKPAQVLKNCRSVLSPGGKLALQIGDVRERGEYQALPFHVFYTASKVGFCLAAPEIVRFQHGASSSSKRYSQAFIPRLHDLCFVLKAAG